MRKHGLCRGIGIDKDKLYDVVDHFSIDSLNTTCSQAFHVGLPACNGTQDGRCSNDTSCFVIVFKNHGVPFSLLYSCNLWVLVLNLAVDQYGGCMCQSNPNDESKVRCNELDSPTTSATPTTHASTSSASSTTKMTSRITYLSFSDTFETSTFVAIPTNFHSKISAVMTSSPTATITTGAPQTESHIGAIIGGTIGGLLTICLCLALAFFYRRYKDKTPPLIEVGPFSWYNTFPLLIFQ
jgi:hypothetical protein